MAIPFEEIMARMTPEVRAAAAARAAEMIARKRLRIEVNGLKAAGRPGRPGRKNEGPPDQKA